MHEPLIVVGPGRCGTSAVAGVLRYLGVFMGHEFIEPDASNPYGHWEDREFFALNSAFLSGAPASTWKGRAKALIESRYQLAVPWGWKDPRTCDVLQHYLSLLRKPRFIRCRRAPEEIHASIMNAYGGVESNGWTWESAERLQQQRDQVLDRILPRYDTMEVDFDRMLSNRNTIVLEIIRFAGLADLTPDRVSFAVHSIRLKRGDECVWKRS
jgi:hypothetical protein